MVVVIRAKHRVAFVISQVKFIQKCHIFLCTYYIRFAFPNLMFHNRVNIFVLTVMFGGVWYVQEDVCLLYSNANLNNVFCECVICRR